LPCGIQDVFAARHVAQNGTVSRDSVAGKIVRPAAGSTEGQFTYPNDLSSLRHQIAVALLSHLRHDKCMIVEVSRIPA
jgi:hypothetical protein